MSWTRLQWSLVLEYMVPDLASGEAYLPEHTEPDTDPASQSPQPGSKANLLAWSQSEAYEEKGLGSMEQQSGKWIWLDLQMGRVGGGDLQLDCAGRCKTICRMPR